MPTIELYTEHLDPLAPSASGGDALARFEAEAGTLLLPIVDDGRLLGVIERDPFLRQLARTNDTQETLNAGVVDLMDVEPVVIEGSIKLMGMADVLLQQSNHQMTRGFVVTQQGRYMGVGSLFSLLKAEHDLRSDADFKRFEIQAIRAEADDAIQSAAQARSGFLALLSRELRTPLNGVAAVADLLRRQPIGPDAHAYVQTIIDSSEATLRILEDAVDLSRADAGELILDPQPIHLRQFMDDLEGLWAPRALQDGVSLMIGYEGDTELAAEIDGARLRQVFNHLIGNALKFARNGVVEAFLAARAEGEDVVLQARVRDNGPGIAPERIPGLFEVGGTHDASKAGGLGLPICHQVLKTMGGGIRVSSNAGQGVTFTFDVTAPAAHVEAETVDARVAGMGQLSLSAAPHILIVDDNGTNRIVAQALCEMFGCTSAQAEDGVEAVEAVQAGRYDLILMDIKMPRMDGVEATQAIRALGSDKGQIPIIALTANADPEDAKRYVASGMAAVVEKPIKPERLMQAINAALFEVHETDDQIGQRRVA
ncbi:response regulator [Brevundimonas aveniformis]|uniref:response regulator n=1 Tax=Brevundimonas aveniformis TaxID=370977 RepID=UPI00248FD41B|nr:response regulator [Brevundimonas aveniformis]